VTIDRRREVPDWIRRVRGIPYAATVVSLKPFNALLRRLRARTFVPGSVLHISYMGHVPFQTVQILREHGIRADYLAVGTSPIWDRSDYQMASARWPWMTALREFRLLWRVVARYEIVHAHFMVTLTRTGWELPILKRMGRKLVVHFRGCEIRNRARNQALHPRTNICEECDYDPRICEAPHNVRRRKLAAAFGDATLVTTPDMKDFAPDATHVRFFTAPVSRVEPASRRGAERFRIVHATNHPGIEGTRHIVAAVESLKQKGYDVDLRVLSGVTQERVLAEMAAADLTIGKMKMGYYANAQVESLALGVPAVCHVRPEFMTPELADSGLIFATLETLETTLEEYLRNPRALADKRSKARESAARLHDNAAIAAELRALYHGLHDAGPETLSRSAVVA
jgi:hypothetical protein